MPREVEEPPPTPRRSLFFCCCGSAVDDLAQEVQLQVKAARAPPPLELQHGYANEENEKRGMAAPKFGTFEVVNKNRQGEIIGVLVATNAEELVANRRDPNGYVGTHLYLLPEQTVMHGTFDEDSSMQQVALFYGCKYRTLEKAQAGTLRDNFEFVKVYQSSCRGKNVLLKYKKGDLEPQRGASEGLVGKVIGKKSSVGGGIDMKTNIDELQLIHPSAG
uniref:Uncharacterized protein n=1 Tax=Phaeocystis antarctica TaxID=33657 RepID=A0A7S0EAC7_9EUKA